MKRSIAVWTLVCLLLMAAVAGAEAPAAGPLSMEQHAVRGNASFTAASYPEIWITPIFDEHIIVGLEKYPAHFLRFAPPEGCEAMEFDYDDTVFIDHENLLTYEYYAYDSASFELFLEKAEAEHTLLDGSDGVAMYITPDSRRAQAMLDISEWFGKTAKLSVYISDHTRDITGEALTALIEAEVARLQDAMEFVELDHFWSEGVIAGVQLKADNDPVTVKVDTAGWIVTKVQEDTLLSKWKASERMAGKRKLTIDTYTYVDSKDDVTELTLADGATFRVYSTDLSSYAALTLLEEGKRGAVHLTIQIDGAPEDFAAALQEVYDRLTIEVGA